MPGIRAAPRYQARDEHIPVLLEVPGGRRIRRFRLVRAMHAPGPEALEEPGYQAAISALWRDRVVASAPHRERRVFGLRNAIGA